MEPGSIIDDRFEIERLAGKGGMGTVYAAKDRRTGALVALKILREGSAERARRFAMEAELLASLDQPGIVRYVAHGKAESGDPYLAMEWLDGEDLAQRLKRGRLTIAESVEILARAAAALAPAHARGVVHRDIKPSNLFLCDRDPTKIKILDFGLARLEEEPSSTGQRSPTLAAQNPLGTPAYMAPEQARGVNAVDARADVFSLGCVLFECLTGTRAFTGEHALAILLKILLDEVPSVRDRCPDVPDALERLVYRLLAKDTAHRPSDAAAVAAELTRISAVGSTPPPAEEPSGLTILERRIVSLVLVGPGASLDVVKTSPAVAGARLELLLDGSILVIPPNAGTATDQAARAASCALSLRDDAPTSPIAVAIGRSEAMGRVPMGEAIDRAARLLRAGAEGTGPKRLRLDEVTAGLLDARFAVAGDALGLYLLGLRGNEAPRTLLGKPTPCVGRDAELRELDDLFAATTLGKGARIALVTSPPGIGKSRVRQEFVRRIRERSQRVEVWIGRGDPMGAGSAFGLIAEAVRRATNLVGGELLPVRRQRLRARVGRHVPPGEADRVAEFLGEMIGTPFSAEDSLALQAARRDPMVMGDQIRRAFEDFVAAECAAQPVVLVLEDLHWGDVPTVKLVDGAVRLLPDKPLFVLALARPEVAETFPDLWAERDVHPIKLEGLTREASEDIARIALGDGASPEVIAELIDRAGGNAFYLEELIRAVAEGEREAMPETVLAMVEARLGAMDPMARRILRAASVFGQVFWRGGVMALLGGEAEAQAAQAVLDDLVRRELVSRRAEARFAGEVEYVFRHALVREAAYATLTEGDRPLGHRLAAEWLTRAGETDPMVLAEHFERGGDRARAATSYQRAAAKALGGNDFRAAFARAERGARSGATGEALGALLLIQAEASKWLSENTACKRDALAAMALLPRGAPGWCEAATVAGVAAVRIGDGETLSALHREIASLLGGATTSALRIAAAKLSAFMFTSGRSDLGRPLLGSLESAVAGRALEPLDSAWIQWARSVRALFDDDLTQYLGLHAEVGRALDAAGDARSACALRINVGDAYNRLGAYAEAERVFRRAIADADRMGLAWAKTSARHGLGWSMARLGRLAEARTMVSEVVEEHKAHGDKRFEGCARVYLAVILALASDGEGAAREANRATDVLRSVRALRPFARAALALILLGAGKVQEASQQARAAAEALASLGSIEEGEGLVRLAFAETLAASGDHAAARQAIAEARDALLVRARKLTDPALHRSFLTNVPEHARTLALAAHWLGEASGA